MKATVRFARFRFTLFPVHTVPVHGSQRFTHILIYLFNIFLKNMILQKNSIDCPMVQNGGLGEGFRKKRPQFLFVFKLNFSRILMIEFSRDFQLMN